MIILFQTLPPSFNHAWRAGERSIYKSPQAKVWSKNAAWEVAIQRKGKIISGPIKVQYEFAPPMQKSDLDNRIKLCQDALTAGGIIKDDSQVIEIHAFWNLNLTGARITITEKTSQAQAMPIETVAA